MTITLHDVELILGIPAYGTPVHIKHIREQLVGIVKSDFDVRYISNVNDSFARSDIGQKDIIHACEDVVSQLEDRMRVSCYVLSIMGNYLFTDKSEMSMVNYKL